MKAIVPERPGDIAGWYRVCVYAILAALAASTVYTALRTLGAPMYRDTPIMHYVAWEILGGKAPYKDVFDMNMPGTYLIHMFIIRVFGPGMVAWHFFNIVWASLTSLLIILYCAPYGRWAAAAASLLFVCYYFGNNPPHIGQRDFLMCPFLMYGAYCWARYLEDEFRARHLLLGGLALGAAATIKPLVLVLLAIVATSHVVKTHRDKKRLVAGGVGLVVGTLIAPALALLWLLSRGSVAAMWKLVTEYLPLYADLPGESKIPILLGLGTRFFIPVVVFPLIPTLVRLRSGDRYSRYSVLIGGSLYGFLHFLLQRKGWYYHLFPVNLFLFTLVAMALGDALREREQRTRTIAIAMLAVISLPFAARCFREGRSTKPLSEVNPVVTRLVQDISEYSLSSDAQVQVLDATAGGIHALYLLKIHEPTRFVYDMHFYHDMDRPVIQELRRELVGEMEKKPPKLVVLFKDTWVQPKGFSKLKSFPELAALLEANYKSDKSHYDYTIYVAR